MTETETHHVYFLLDGKGTVHDVFAAAKAEDVPSGYTLKQLDGSWDRDRALVLADTIRTRIRSSYVAPSWETFKKTLPQSAPQDFTAGYFGTRSIDALKEVRPYIDAYETFADLTAGGGRFPYSLATTSKRVAVNDRCGYAYYALASVLLKQTEAEAIPYFYEQLQPNAVGKSYGYFTLHAGRAQNVAADVKQYVDAACNVHQGNSLVLYGLGKALRQFYTYRGIASQGWIGRLGNGLHASTVTPGMLFESALRHMWVATLYAKRIARTDNLCYNLDVLDAIAALPSDFVEGSCLYVDPAWPWAPGFVSDENPYMWYSEDLSSVLKQERITIPFWDEGSSQQCLADVVSWIRAGLARDARTFIVCGQDTNWPPVGVIGRTLTEHFPRCHELHVDALGHATQHKYSIYWWIVSA